MSVEENKIDGKSNNNNQINEVKEKRVNKLPFKSHND